jgi:hypothetical protein
MQGSMKTHRSIIRRGGVLFAGTLALAAATPLSAQAGPLLSGYGAPGQGNQAILGSTLLGGGGGGSAGASGVSSASGSGSGESSLKPSVTGSAGGPASRASGRSPHGAPRAAGAGVAGATAGGTAVRAYPAAETSGASHTLGLSGADLLYIILAALALLFTGVFTRIVAGARTAKGHE